MECCHQRALDELAEATMRLQVMVDLHLTLILAILSALPQRAAIIAHANVKANRSVARIVYRQSA